MSRVEQRLRDGWKHLDGPVDPDSHVLGGTSSSATSSWRWFDTGLGLADNAYVLGIDTRGTNHLFIRCEAHEDFPGPSKGQLEIEKTFLELGIASPSWFLDIRCGSHALTRQFRTVASDVVERTLDSPRPARDALSIVAEWRALFAQLSDQPKMTYQRRMSLFAELSALVEVAEVTGELDPRWWRGPFLEPHDIEHPNFSIEVKAVGHDSTSTTIHGADQLDLLDGKPLLLHIATVEESDDGESLESLARRVIELAKDRTSARSALIKAGVTEHGHTVDTTPFKISDTTTISVDSSTPRITGGMFADGVHPAIIAIKYDVDLATLSGLASGPSLTSLLEEIQ